MGMQQHGTKYFAHSLPPPPPFDLTHPTSIWVRLKSDIEIIQKKIKLTTKTEVDRLLTF